MPGVSLTGACSRFIGLAWLAGWCLALYAVASPWEDLGGLVGERLRWLERFVLFSGIVVGYCLGGSVRQGRPPGSARAYFRSLRRLLYPAAMMTAAGLVALHSSGATDPEGVVFTGFLAYWAGVDAAHGAMPLLAGNLLETEHSLQDRSPPARRR